jgi:HEAT repeat protein
MKRQKLPLHNRVNRKAIILVSAWLGLLTVSSAYAAAQTAPASQPAASAIDSQVFSTTRDLFRIGFNSSISGSLVLGALHSTSDPQLKDYFMAVSHSSDPELKLIALLDANGISHDPGVIDPKQFLAINAPEYISPSLAMLIQFGAVTDAQLEQIQHLATDPAQRLMAAAEMVNRGKFTAAADTLHALISEPDPAVCYYAALTLLQIPEPIQDKLGLEMLKQLQANREYSLDALKQALLDRIADQKITAALPWAQTMAQDADNSIDVRQEALSTLLELGDPASPDVFTALLSSNDDIVSRVELGMTAIRFGPSLTPADVASLAQTDSPLLQGIAHAASLAVAHQDPTPAILDLVQQGQPIFLNWILDYAVTPQAHDRIKLLTALVNYAVITDGDRGQDYQRGLQAALAMADSDTPADRAALSGFLDSTNQAVVEIALAGMLQSKNANFAPLVREHWTDLLASTDDRIPQFAALVLGRQGDKTALPELAQIVTQDLDRSVGFRAVAGWYYLKITGQSGELLQNLDNTASMTLSTQPVTEPATMP